MTSVKRAERLAFPALRMVSARSQRLARLASWESRARAANAGATVAQLEAIFGWTGGNMASLYTRSSDRRRLAREAMHKLANAK